MLIGLVLGWILDESFSDALLGALLGLGIGQALRMARMDSQAVEQQRLLEQAQVALQAVEQRLALLEASGVKAPEAREPLVSPETILDEAPAAAPELVWELPPELEPIAAAASETNRSQPADAWKPEPIARAATTTCHLRVARTSSIAPSAVPEPGCSAAIPCCGSAWCCCSSAWPFCCAMPPKAWWCRLSCVTQALRRRPWGCSGWAGGCGRATAVMR